MEQITELKFEELTVEQKLGMTTVAYCGPASREGVKAGIDVLAGECPANGKLIYDVK